MKIRNVFSGSRMAMMFWLSVSLGSCAYVQTIHNSNFTTVYDLSGEAVAEVTACQEFVRAVRLGHVQPALPQVDITKLTSDQINDVLLTYTEKLKKYITDDQQFLLEDIARHNQKCAQGETHVFQKGSGI